MSANTHDAASTTAEFIFAPEQEELRSTVRRYLTERFPREELHRVTETPEGYDAAAWPALGAELGLPAVVVPEALGGAGGTAIEMLVISEELGRALYCSPWFASCVLGLTALLAADDPGVSSLITGIAEAQATAAVASDELMTPGAPNQVTASTDTEGVASLSGIAEFVLDGATAEHLLVLAADAAGGSLYLVEGRDGVTAEPLTSLDLTRRIARVAFSGAQARLAGQAGNAAAVLERLVLTAGLASAAESLGGMQSCLETAAEYAKTRFQFGRPIGSFQAVKHRIANMLVHVEICRTAVQHAAWACASNAPDAALAVHMAQAQVSDAYLAVAADNIQSHGGIGFTWDHDAHLFFRRSKSAQLMLGGSAYHRDRVADLVGV